MQVGSLGPPPEAKGKGVGTVLEGHCRSSISDFSLVSQNSANSQNKPVKQASLFPF